MSVLELGAGNNPSNYSDVRHDRIIHSEHIDVAHDLNDIPWPWKDEEWDRVIAIDVFEHLNLQPQEWLDEVWRILKPDGELTMRLPAWDNPTSWRDPTHRRVFHEETFDYWEPGKELYNEFGVYYFAESSQWWTVVWVSRESEENQDFRYILRKISQ